VKQILGDLGFCDIAIIPKHQSKDIIQSWNIGKGTENIVFSAYIKAFKAE
jgi:thermostable 8-oxoguanine DNA glycosylase